MLLPVLAAIVALVGAFIMWPRTDRITAANCGLIREGMSQSDVEGILGGPPGDYRTVPTKEWMLKPYRPGEEPKTWQGDTGDIQVVFSPDGAHQPRFRQAQRIEQSLLDDILWRAKRQWKRWFPK
jgi:hypothetical protein